MTRKREGAIARETLETKVRATLRLDGSGRLRIKTGLGFFDHMLSALALHAGWDLTLSCTGDLRVDDHHTVEDTGLVLGQAVDKALGVRRSIARFGWAYAPLDEALARAAVDLSGRPFFAGELSLARDRVGDLSCEMVPHFFHSFAQTGRLALHLDVIRGANDHHRIEAAFKACALALRAACSRSSGSTGASSGGTGSTGASSGDDAAPSGEAGRIPSTKGVL